jgi:hypothetical protein
MNKQTGAAQRQRSAPLIYDRLSPIGVECQWWTYSAFFIQLSFLTHLTEPDISSEASANLGSPPYIGFEGKNLILNSIFGGNNNTGALINQKLFCHPMVMASVIGLRTTAKWLQRSDILRLALSQYNEVACD